FRPFPPSFSSSFFSYFSVDLRDLHSFPTRRSSDLILYGCWFCPRFPGSKLIQCVERKPYSRSVSAKSARQDLQGQRGRPASWRRDRKSTRLNSSHRTISYAVFCLKKKNNHRKKK